MCSAAAARLPSPPSCSFRSRRSRGGGAAALVGAAIVRRRFDLERPGALAAAAVCLFVLPVVLHGFEHWSPKNGNDPYALTPGLVHALRTDLPKRAVVFSDLETSYRIAAFAPVLVAAAPPAHVADTTKNLPYRRMKDVKEFFGTGSRAILRKY